MNPKPLPLTPEDARAEAYRTYRRHTRPFRRAFRGIISRKDAERFIKARLAKQTRALRGASR